MREQDYGVKWFNTRFYPAYYTGRAVRYEDGVLTRLRAHQVTLFTPWGPRYDYKTRGTSIRENDKEVVVLDFLAKIWNRFTQCMPYKSWRWVFLGADVYGSRINPLPETAVTEYFSSFREQLGLRFPKAEFRLWSEFEDRAEPVRQKIRANFGQYFEPAVEARAAKTAAQMGLGSDHRAYLVERLAEAMVIEECLAPIKISCVARHKDDHVDGDLPRLYLLQPKHHRPWMG